MLGIENREISLKAVTSHRNPNLECFQFGVLWLGTALGVTIRRIERVYLVSRLGLMERLLICFDAWDRKPYDKF